MNREVQPYLYSVETRLTRLLSTLTPTAIHNQEPGYMMDLGTLPCAELLRRRSPDFIRQ